MKARDIMTSELALCTPDDTVQQAARLMISADCGCLPVVEDFQTRRLVGIITDRDITCRIVAEGTPNDARVYDAMSTGVSCCHPDDEVQAVEDIMEERQVRRVPVIDGSGACVGIIAQADLVASNNARGREIKRVIGHISEPIPEPRSEAHRKTPALV